ncbi:hypothetical protein D4764_0092670 [Takifugu flavidus]|uniref:Reverse transcriptase domain-containing protein n=1 Tax=Takifugu flavidus TaxID=433684 RepID=A0A5C6MJD5_9TELE|nr:hypothetical protein D4764_0092670 [Takifugu flavidus]
MVISDTREPQQVLVVQASDSVTISTGSPQGCVLSPLLFSLYTNCCTSSHQSVKLIKFADDTTLIGGSSPMATRLPTGGGGWLVCPGKSQPLCPPLPSWTPPSPHVTDSFRFLGTTITRDLKWEPTISSLIKKAQQRMFFLRKLRKLKLPPRMLAQFYTAIIESILTSSITVWFAGATARDRLRLQRVVRAAEKVIGCRRSHPSRTCISPGPGGRRLRSIRTRTSRYTNSFFPSAIRLLNTK